MVFQKPTPFPMSIYDNIAFGVRLHETPVARRDGRARRVGAEARRRCGTRSRTSSNQSGIEPVRRPAAAPVHRARHRGQARGAAARRADARRSTRSRPRKIEELIDELKADYTIVIVTHNMQQAARVSDYTAYMYLGDLIEFGATDEIFIKPEEEGDRGLHHRPLRLIVSRCSRRVAAEASWQSGLTEPAGRLAGILRRYRYFS